MRLAVSYPHTPNPYDYNLINYSYPEN
jgi:hypothetical protein